MSFNKINSKLFLRLTISILVFLFVQSIAAQNKGPEVFFIKTDTLLSIKLPPEYWQILPDKSDKLTIKQITGLEYDDKFSKYDTTAKMDYSTHTYWFKFRLKNFMEKPVQVGIDYNLQNAEFYFPDTTGNWNKQITGKAIPYSRRDGLKGVGHSYFVLQPGLEVTVYQRRHFVFRTPDTFSPDLVFTEKLIEKEYLDNTSIITSTTIYSVIFGFSLIAFFVFLMFYRVIREKEYLYFALFIICIGLSSFIEAQTTYGILKEYPILVNYINNFFAAGFIFFIIHFFRSLFKVKNQYPRWDKVLIVFSVLPALSLMLVYSGLLRDLNSRQFNIAITAIYIPLIFSLDCIFITLLLFAGKKEKAINTTVIAAIPFFFLFGPVYTITSIIEILNITLKTPKPAWVTSYREIFPLIYLAGIIWFIILFSTLLFRRYRKLQTDLAEEALTKERMQREQEQEKIRYIAQQNEMLEGKVKQRTEELQKSINDLKSTQSQLIQSEKMASLGELTAGIAHEIQNPLNFVNNFSEVNTELIDELKAELKEGKIEEALELANDIADNEQKINHHGKRADNIVKSMLQHSRKSTGNKELTNINALADEYLRLAYHGLRAKDKSFNASLETHFDESIGKIDVIPQDIGRVILNLITNALYATNEKKKQDKNGFHPTVSVNTKNLNGTVQLIVKDNGTGIPNKVLDKIFQPFFTTKPTGQGTGLGLSMSYDIIKAHGGDFKVETKEGEGTTFIISLPQ